MNTNKSEFAITEHELIEVVCSALNTSLKDMKPAFSTRKITAKEFYKRAYTMVDTKYNLLMIKYQIAELNSEFVIAKTMRNVFLRHIKNENLHKVKRFLGGLDKEEKANFYAKF